MDLNVIRELLDELPSTTTTSDGYKIDVDVAIASIERGDVQPIYEEYGDGPDGPDHAAERGYLRAIVWMDGPWWAPVD